MTVSTRGQTVEPPDGENNIVPVQPAGIQVEPQSAPDNDAVTAHNCNDANCTCREPDFPHAKLAILDEKISSPRWVVPVLPDQELETLMQAAIALCRTGDDVRSEACQRFFREGLTISFTKILTDEAVNSWKFNIHQCIYHNCLKLVELCVVKLADDWFPLLELLAMVFNPNNRFHTFNSNRASESVPVGSKIPEEEIYARPPDLRTPRGWLVDLINKFGSLGGFQILVERFQTGDNVPVPVVHALIRPFGLCYELLTVHTIEKYLMPIVERVPTFLDNLTDEELKKEAKNESKNDAISSIIKSAKFLVSRVSGQEETVKQLEIFRLKMILRLLQISSFNGKMNALNEVNKVIAGVSYYPHRHATSMDPEGEWLTPERMAKWIKENGVLQIVLRDSLHQPQYVEKLEKILRFVIKERCLSLEDLDSLWAAQHGKHEAIVKNVHDLLAKLAWDFSPEQLDHLFECFQSSWTSANKKQREKLLELIRRLAEDDKDGVMAHKVLSLFWNLAHSDDVVTEIMDQALNAHVKILDYSCSQERDAQKTEWLNRCVEELKNNEKWVLPALKQIREIACLYEQPPNTNQRTHQICYRQEVINKLQTDHQLVILVANNLTNYMEKVRRMVKDNAELDPSHYMPDGRYNHIVQVQERLNFLRFLLKDGQLWLCAEQAKQIWKCLAEGAVFTSDREACFKWFSKLMGEEPDLDPAVIKDFFQNNVLQLDPSLLTESGMKCFERFFKAVNSKEGKLKVKKRMFLMDDVDLIGNEYVWRVVTSSGDEMAARAIQLLKEVTTNLGPRLQAASVQFHQTYISECLDRLRAHYDTVNVLRNGTPNLPRVHLECVKMCRVLKVLKEYISEYDGEFAGERKFLPLYRYFLGNINLRDLKYHVHSYHEEKFKFLGFEKCTILQTFWFRHFSVSAKERFGHIVCVTQGFVNRHTDGQNLLKLSSKFKIIGAYRGKQVTLIVRFSQPGRVLDDIEIQTHGNETVGVARRFILRRLKAGATQHVKLDLYFNGELLDPSEDRRLLGELHFSDKILLTGKWSQANTNMGSSPDSSSDSSTSSPQHPYDTPSIEAENSLPGVLLSQQPQTTASLLRVCDLASSLGNTALAQVAYSVLNLCPPDMHTWNTLQQLFQEIDDLDIPPSSPSIHATSPVTLESILYNSPSPQVLYNLEVLYALLMPAVDPLSEKAFEMQFSFFKSSHSSVLLDILTKNNFMPTADITGKRHAYLTVLKICKLMLCIIGHILYMNAENNSQQQGSNLNSPTNCAALLKQALCNIPSPVSEIVIRNISSKVAQAYIEKYGVENKWSNWSPSQEMIHALMQFAWTSACGDISLMSVNKSILQEPIHQACTNTSDILVCKEALEVLTMTLVLNSTALENLLEDKKWTNFIIDLVLLCNNRTVRMVAAEQFLLMVTLGNSQKPLHFSITLLFSVLHTLVMDYAKNSHEYFQLLCRLINFSCMYNCPLPSAETLLLNEIKWLKLIKEQVKSSGKTGVEEAVLDGHLGIAKELFSFMSPEMKYQIGSDETSGGNLIRELVEDFIFPASKMMLHLQRTGELIADQAVPVCNSPLTLSSAFELLVSLCDNCVANMRLLVNMLTDMFYSDSEEGLQEWDYLPPIGPRPPSGFVGLKNAGATCYMNSVLQQLYMVTSIRQGLLAAEGATSDSEDFYTTDTESIISNSGDQEEKSSLEESRKEYNIGILKQVQAIFGHLAYSKLQYYIPKGLWKHFKLQGEPVNLREQQDAVEFFMSLVESIDDALKALGQEQIMSKILGGSYSDQKICKGCPHRYSKEEPFSVISVDIRNQSTLQDSLEQYVKGELLEGADAYHCDKCNKKVVTVKRLCVKKLPPILTIQLKRFEYDYERVCAIKFNDYFEFPRLLDMEPYTVSGLAKIEGEVDCDYNDSPKDVSTKYQLSGIVVHSGQASGGHYYSYILHRLKDGSSKWYKFDDGEVTECKMEDDEEMKSQCFGGEYTGEVFDHMLKRMTYRRQKRWWNAYMLYYTRQDAEDESLVKSMNQLSLCDSKHGLMKMPLSIERSVRRQNISFMHTRNQFSAEYFQFMRRLATCTIPPPSRQHNADKCGPDAEELSLLSVQIVSRFLFHTGFHTKKCLRGQATDWYDAIYYHIRAFASVRSWIAHNILFKHQNRFCEYLLTCPSTEVRTVFMKLVVFLAHYSLPDGPCPSPMVNAPTILLDPKATMSDHLLLAVLSMLHKEVSENGRHLFHYFSLFFMYASLGLQEKMQLLKLDVPTIFMLVALDEGPGPAIKYQYPELTKLHCVVSQLIRCCDITSKTQSSQPGQQPLPNPYGETNPAECLMPIQPQAEEILFGRSRSLSYIKKIIEDCQATEEGSKMLKYCCWENPHFSRTVLSELLWQIAFAYCHELRHHIDLLLAVVTIEDSWLSHRLHNALKGVPDEREGLFDTIQRSKSHYQKRAYQCIKCLVALFTECRPALQLLHSNAEFKQKWTLAIEWLQDELERRPYGSNTQYSFNSWSPPAQSNDSANGFYLERSPSARKTLDRACELCPDDEPEIDCEELDLIQGEEVKPGPSHQQQQVPQPQFSQQYLNLRPVERMGGGGCSEGTTWRGSDDDQSPAAPVVTSIVPSCQEPQQQPHQQQTTTLNIQSPPSITTVPTTSNGVLQQQSSPPPITTSSTPSAPSSPTNNQS